MVDSNVQLFSSASLHLLYLIIPFADWQIIDLVFPRICIVWVVKSFIIFIPVVVEVWPRAFTLRRRPWPTRALNSFFSNPQTSLQSLNVFWAFEREGGGLRCLQCFFSVEYSPHLLGHRSVVKADQHLDGEQKQLRCHRDSRVNTRSEVPLSFVKFQPVDGKRVDTR